MTLDLLGHRLAANHPPLQRVKGDAGGAVQNPARIEGSGHFMAKCRIIGAGEGAVKPHGRFLARGKGAQGCKREKQYQRGIGKPDKTVMVVKFNGFVIFGFNHQGIGGDL